jgi:cell division protein FtsI (penicillin-binding protein 3)
MTRTPLRPLARILRAREQGENPDAIEREAMRLRHEAMRDRARQRAEFRLLLLVMGFCVGFATVGVRMGVLAATEPAETGGAVAGTPIQAQRADITDRAGRVLATNLTTSALYAHPKDLIDPAGAAAALATIFPDIDPARLERQFTDGRRFLWIRRQLSPEQVQAVHEIGEPGLLFGPRETRIYPNGRLAAHVLGGATFGAEGVHSAEVIGMAGIEKALDTRLRAPAHLAEPLALSIDLTVQAAVEDVLDAGMRMLNARGAAAIVMHARTGEIVAMASLPDFDPNDRPAAPVSGDPGDSPLFNRAVQGVYELGSVMKVFPVAQALDLGIANAQTVIDTRGPMMLGRFRVRDFRNYGPELTVTQIVVKSSNIGTARLITRIGGVAQRAFLESFGFLAPVPLELVEAPGGRPLLPARWGDIASATISYGHGLSASPLHLAGAYAALVNGGTAVTPTLLRADPAALTRPGRRLVSEHTSAELRRMLRLVVTEGTASMAEVPGYALGGKTGTADKMKPGGGYFDDRVMANFAGAFPMNDPQYVIVVSLDEPVETSGREPRRTAGWTAVPVTAEIVRRIAPLLGLRPTAGPAVDAALTRVRN